MSRIALDRVVLNDPIDKPLNRSGKMPGLERVFDRRGSGPLDKAGRPVNEARYDLWFDAGLITIRDKDSHHEELVPMHMVRQMRTVASVEAGEKESGSRPPTRGQQLP